MKKITACLLCMVMLLALFPSGAACAYSQTDVGEDLEILCALGVIAEGGIETGDEISRADAVYYSMKICGYSFDEGSSDGKESEVFSDVGAETEHFRYIAAAYEMGIISGGEFRPNDSLTLNEAIKIFSSVLGYGTIAELDGGFPSGYFKYARRAGVLNGCVLPGGDSAVSSDLFVKMLRNTIEATAIDLETVKVKDGSSTVSYGDSNNSCLLDKVFDAVREKGIVEADSYTSIYDESGIEKTAVAINGTVYYADGIDASALLGCEAEVYIKRNGSGLGTVIWAKIIDEDRQITHISSEDIDRQKTTASNLVYYGKGDRETNMVIPRSATLIKDGIRCALDDKALLMPQWGELDLIDNNYDGKADVIKVFDYKTMIVGQTDKTNECLFDRQNGTCLDISAKNGKNVVIFKNGKKAAFDELREKDIVLYTEALNGSKKYIVLKVSDKSISGKVTKQKDNKVTVGSDEYLISADAAASVTVGTKGKFYTDILGRIAYAEFEREKVYGYLNELGMEKTLDKTVKLKIFTENNRWVTLSCLDKIKFNGSMIKAETFYNDNYSSDKSFRQLITYMVDDDGKIKEVNFAQSFERRSSEEDAAISGNIFRLYGSLTSGTYRSSYGSFNNLIALMPDAKIFLIPVQSGSGSASEKDFSVVGQGSLSAGEAYNNITAYDADKVGRAAACVCIGNAGVIDKKSNVAVVLSTANVMGDDGEITAGISCMLSGSEVTLPIKPDNTSLNTMASGLEEGDVIQVYIDTYGYVTAISLLFDMSLGDNQKSISGGVYSSATMVAGEILYFDGSSNLLQISYPDEGIFSASSLNTVYLYDKNAPHNKVRTASKEILTPGRYGFFRIQDFMIKEIMIIE